MNSEKVVELKHQLENDIDVGFPFEFEIVDEAIQSEVAPSEYNNVILRYGKVIVTDDIADIAGMCKQYTNTYETLIEMLEYYIKDEGEL